MLIEKMVQVVMLLKLDKIYSNWIYSMTTAGNDGNASSSRWWNGIRPKFFLVINGGLQNNDYRFR